MSSRERVALVVIALAGCGGEPASSGDLVVSAPVQVVPFGSTPSGVELHAASAQVDAISHGGRTWLAFRTSASWFADDDTRIVVVSAQGEIRWEHEVTLETGRDLRNPRFLALGDRLLLFFGVHDVNDADPDPLGSMVTERLVGEGDAGWSDPVDVLEPGVVPSRIRWLGDRPVMTAWSEQGGARAVHLLTTDDGLSWSALGTDAVQQGGGSETDVVGLADGSLVAVTQNDLGDDLGWGSRLCRAPSADAAWTCSGDPRRFDDPALVRQGDRVWLLARRHLTDDGAYDLARDDLSPVEQTDLYRSEYLAAPKRCAVWEVDPATLTVAHRVDLPSRGETCGASILGSGDGAMTVYYHSSPLDGADVPLRIGQAGATRIVRVVLQ